MLDQNKHRNYMYQILINIAQSPLKNYIAWKGGTLSYFMHGLNRFSTDLEFDMIVKHPDIIPLMQNILKKYGKIKDQYNKRHTIFFLLDYGSHQHNIKIEISKLKKKNDKYTLINFFGLGLQAMQKDCIFANKLVALSQRYKNRDLFDVNFFYKNFFPINTTLIHERTGLSYKRLLQKLKIEIPKHYNSKNVLAEIGELLTDKQKHFVKNRLITEVLSQIEFEIFKS